MMQPRTDPPAPAERPGSAEGSAASAPRPFSLSLVATAFNERELIEEFLHKSARDLAAVTDDWEIILVNDGSTDGTLELACATAAKNPRIRVLDLGRNLGTGSCYIPGFYAASREIVFNNTVDAFFDTAELPRMLPLLREFDVLSGYRSDLKANNLYQKLLTVVNYRLIRLLFGLPLRAFQTLQFHRRAFFDEIEMEARSSFLSPELLFKASRLGRRIGEVPIVFHARKAGTAKGGRLVHVLRSVRNILHFWWRWRVLRRPLRRTQPVPPGTLPLLPEGGGFR